MKGKPILMGILFSLIIAFTYWKFTQGFDPPKDKYWTQEKINSWVEKIVSSSVYLADIDSSTAYEIGKCATERMIDSFAYEEMVKIDKLNIDSQKIVLEPIVFECIFPVGFQNINTTISDTSQIRIAPDEFN